MEGIPEEILEIIFKYLDIESLLSGTEVTESWRQIIRNYSLKLNFLLDICVCNIDKVLKLKGKFNFKNIRIKHSEQWHQSESQFIDNVLEIITDNRSHVTNLILDGLHEDTVLRILKVCYRVTNLHVENMLKNTDQSGMFPRRRNLFGIRWSNSCSSSAAHNKYLDLFLQLIEKEKNLAKTNQKMEVTESRIDGQFNTYYDYNEDLEDLPETFDYQFDSQVQEVLFQDILNDQNNCVNFHQVEPQFEASSNQLDLNFAASSSQVFSNVDACSNQGVSNFGASSNQLKPQFSAIFSQVDPNLNAIFSQVDQILDSSFNQVESNFGASSNQVDQNFGGSSSQVYSNLGASFSQAVQNFGVNSSQLDQNFGASLSQNYPHFVTISSQVDPNLVAGCSQVGSNFGACFRQVDLPDSSDTIRSINQEDSSLACLSLPLSSSEVSSTFRYMDNQVPPRKRPIKNTQRKLKKSNKKRIFKDKLIEIPTLKYLEVQKAQNIFDIIRAPNLKSLTVTIFNPQIDFSVIQNNQEKFNNALQKATKFIKIQNFIKTTLELKILILNNLNVNCVFGFVPYPFKLEKLSITTYGSDEFNSKFPMNQRNYFHESILKLLKHQKISLKNVSVESKFLKFSQDQILSLMEGENISKLSVDARQNDNNLIDFKFDKFSKELKFFGGLSFENEFIELIERFPKTRNLNLKIEVLPPKQINALRIISELMPNLTFLSINPFFTKISEDFKFESIKKLDVHDLREKCGSVDWDQIILACPNIIELSLHDDYFRIKSDNFEKIIKTSKNLKIINKYCKKEFSVPYNFYKFFDCKSLIIDTKISIFAKITFGRYKTLTYCLSNNPEFCLSYEPFDEHFNCEDPKSYLKSFEIKRI